MTVTVIQHEKDEGLGVLGEALRARGVQTRIVQAQLGEPIPDTAGDALVLLGGPMAAYDDIAHIHAERALAQASVAAGKPVLGICLGAQILATALGGNVRRAVAPENGWFPVTRLADDPVLGQLPETFDVLHAHGDQFDLPPACVHLARSAITPCQAYRFGARVYGFQFHLEATPDIARVMLSEAPDPARHARVHPQALAVFSAFAALIA